MFVQGQKSNTINRGRCLLLKVHNLHQQ